MIRRTVPATMLCRLIASGGLPARITSRAGMRTRHSALQRQIQQRHQERRAAALQAGQRPAGVVLLDPAQQHGAGIVALRQRQVGARGDLGHRTEADDMPGVDQHQRIGQPRRPRPAHGSRTAPAASAPSSAGSGRAGSPPCARRPGWPAARPSAADAAAPAARGRSPPAGARRRTGCAAGGPAAPRCPADRRPRRSRPRPVATRRMPKRRLVATDICGNSRESWNTRPTRRRSGGSQMPDARVGQHLAVDLDPARVGPQQAGGGVDDRSICRRPTGRTAPSRPATAPRTRCPSGSTGKRWRSATGQAHRPSAAFSRLPIHSDSSSPISASVSDTSDSSAAFASPPGTCSAA